MKRSGKKPNKKSKGKNRNEGKHIDMIIIINTDANVSPRRDPEKKPSQIGLYEWAVLLLTAIPVLMEYPNCVALVVCFAAIVLKLKKQLDSESLINSIIFTLEILKWLTKDLL